MTCSKLNSPRLSLKGTLSLLLALAACSSSEHGGSAGSTGSGGSAGSAGLGSGGSGMGGRLPTGGNILSGGSGDGGTSATGGRGSGGSMASGGIATGGTPASNGGTSSGGIGAGGAAAGGTLAAAGGTGSGGTTGTFVGKKTPGAAQNGDITINPAAQLQTMDGFGIADVWQGKAVSTPEQRTLFWDPVNGIGMTILRVGIEGKTGQIMGDAAFVEAPDVVKYGGKVWAAPWSPPAAMKDNNDVNNGGHLLPASYDTWSTTLAAFPAYFKQNAGVDLWAISVQNEPDYKPTYESCLYTGQEMNNFIKVLGPKLKALNPPVRLIAAESFTWGDVWSGSNAYGKNIVGDPTVSALVDVIATHDYASNVKSTTRPAPPAGVKQHIWETEVYYTAGGDIVAATDFARGVYAAIAGGGASAFVYWWTTHFLLGGSTASPPKRVYAMGNFSKFVRPGYVRVDMTGAPSTVQLLAFMSPNDGTFAVVGLNSGTSDQPVSFFISGPGWPTTVTPYVTSASANLAAGTPVTVNAGRFSGTLAASSVTTFVGKQ